MRTITYRGDRLAEASQLLVLLVPNAVVENNRLDRRPTEQLADCPPSVDSVLLAFAEEGTSRKIQPPCSDGLVASRSAQGFP